MLKTNQTKQITIADSMSLCVLAILNYSSKDNKQALILIMDLDSA